MHELSLCQAIASSVAKHAAGRPVSRVGVRIGHLRQVVVDSLLFSWQVLTDGSDLAGCELEVDHVPAVVTCRECGASTTLDFPIMMCGSCEGTEVELVSGEELLIVSIDVPEEAGGASASSPDGDGCGAQPRRRH
ncbi:MAG: hydrogenase maturation nickel metallochaperone HypA [Acidimicrobiia bacterium]